MSEKLTHITVILSRPRGFCAGVVRAIEIVERALELSGPPVYVRHEIVHNKSVVEDLRARGAIFVDRIADIPEGATTVFSAHGVSPSVEEEAKQRFLDVVDATCPLVRKVHSEGRRYVQQGYDVVMIGHRGHAEVEGTMGQIGVMGKIHLVETPADVAAIDVADATRVAYVTQTTLSLTDVRQTVEALKRRFPSIVGPDTRDICFATQNRQAAIASIVDRINLLLVLGSKNSSNANRLREIGEARGVPTYMIEDALAFDPDWLKGVRTVGVTAGASAPERLVQDLVVRMSELRSVSVEEMDGRKETVRFRLPDRFLDGAVRAASGIGR
ncbi:4-hydroxy-3-methylbut-2-enyl diphosphate reductase [Hyphomicrobium zavarzinii]|uniref:4-hydroxy-3-methylbut-2-enyl diphosphate reductase n=1 Tax=Hyphomicrobium zavarzinii TaxID=48292 RepID=UPI00047B73CC|nr:4-hydroxy-3-methylbut-2-enyl diphosphate reductase [Hyphomicrobium zavarzinii]